MSDTLEPPDHKEHANPPTADDNPFVVSGEPAEKSAGGETLRMFIIALAVVLFGLTLGVLFLLPKVLSPNSPVQVAEQAPPEQPTPPEAQTDIAPENETAEAPTETAISQAPVSDDENLALRESAQTLLAEADEKLRDLEVKNVARWAPKELERLKKDLTIGETAYSEQRYQAASNSYKNVIAGLENLETYSATVLTESLAEGELALAAGNAADAQAAFQRALLIDPTNSEALSGKQRAGNLDEVLALIKEAKGFEELGEMGKALERYKAALSIDAKTSDASQAIARINAESRDKSFRAAMSRGFDALDKGKYRDAKKHFTDATSIKPSDNNAAEALAQTNELIKTQQIESLLANANRKSQQEDWPAVEKFLTQAKRLDNSISGVDSRIGTARSRQALEQQLLKYTSESQRLRTDAVHAEALAVIGKAKGISSPGPKLNRQIGALEATIAAARTPRTITLTSDSQTNVTVYKVGKFGAFAEKNLSLYPGKYVAVGKRTGYRDVRLEFAVQANGSAQVFDLRCQEQLQFGTR